MHAPPQHIDCNVVWVEAVSRFFVRMGGAPHFFVLEVLASGGHVGGDFQHGQHRELIR